MTDVEIRDNVFVPDVASASYADLTGIVDSVITIDGVSLIGKEHLIGVPHVITCITFQKIPPVAKDGTQKNGFVSVEATIAGERELARAVARGRVIANGLAVTDVESLLIDPDERIVYNDGSTGVRRQLVKILDAIGLIRVDGTTDRRFDRSWLEWEEAGEQWREQGTDDNDVAMVVPSFTHRADGRPLLINVPRGLYVSAYTNDHGESETFYLK